MRAEYDSEADALSIDIVEAERWDGSEAIDDDYCTVALMAGRPANIELLAPADHLALLGLATHRYALNREALEAAARSARAAPDRTVILNVLISA